MTDTWNVNDLGDAAPALETSTERLLYVAARIENDPDSWDQGTWAAYSSDPTKVAGAHTCGSAGCLAGHGVAATPVEQFSHLEDFEQDSFHYTGMVAFDIESDFAHVLFSDHFGLGYVERIGVEGDDEELSILSRHVANCLRWLAHVPVDKRLKLSGTTAYELSDGTLNNEALAQCDLPPWQHHEE